LCSDAAAGFQTNVQLPALGKAAAGWRDIDHREETKMQPEPLRVHTPAAIRPDFALILARIRGLRPQIAERALAAEKAKRVPAETMEALREAAVFRLMQPARFGGCEYGPAELAEVGFELGRACGSTGWCGTLAVCFGWMTSFFPLQAQQEVWDDPDNLLAVSYTPSPKVEPVDGGIKIAGSWPWASGVDSAAWLILSVLIPGKDAPPTLAWCLVPVTDVIVDHDSWNVSGLQGTGSKTVAIDDPVFVPAHRILPIGAIFSGKVPGLDVPGNAQARFGYPTFGPTALVAPIVGMAQGALDAFTETARGAKRMARPGVFEKVAESQLIQSLIGQAAAHRCGAHAHAHQFARRTGRRALGRDAGDRTARADTAQSRICRAHFVRGRQRDLRQIGSGGGR
jgi:resorcinol 4-hydroxylase (FADH2)